MSCRRNPLREQFAGLRSNYESNNYQERKLRKIIKFSKKHSKYYTEKLSFITDDEIETAGLQELLIKIPYLEKSDLRTKANEDIKIPGVKGIIRETTGSTGIPVKVLVDRYTLAAQLKARWDFFAWHGILPGAIEGRFWGRKEQRYLQSSIKNFLLNRKIFTLDNKDIDKFNRELTILQNAKLDYFYGYPSLILKAAELFDNKNKIKPNPKVIFTTAEMLTEIQRRYISNVFGCPVFQEYGCSEVDIIAFECPNGHYHLNSERLYIEFLPVISGKYEVIISDLDNRCMPILRYKLGDLVELKSKGCDCGLPFSGITRVVGRTSDRLVSLPDGTFFHAVKFSHLIEQACKRGWLVRQYRIDHIEPRNIHLKLEGEFYDSQKKSLENFMINRLNILTKKQIKTEIIFCDIQDDGKHMYYRKYF